jgi:hypothetical protein
VRALGFRIGITIDERCSSEEKLGTVPASKLSDNGETDLHIPS